ncbi:MAG: AAA family ATPase [Acidimicrobiia bacterium]
MPDVAVAEQRRRLVQWLSAGVSEPPSLQETHVSILAFTADRVWKCKKAVRLPFIDLSTLEQRLANCEREVALNRRLAPDVYLGVAPLVDSEGVVIDYLVEMRRLPEACRLSHIVSETKVDFVCVDEIADVLIEFHSKAPTGGEIDQAATPTVLESLWARTLDELRPFCGTVLDALLVDQVRRDAQRYLAGRSRLFGDRIAGRRIRDGHGDLLADDVFCLPDGPRILDCLEFDDQLRFGDVLADVAFLAMDLERLARLDAARRLFDRYRDGSGDVWPRTLEHMYVAYRALVRSKVACLRVDDDVDANSVARALLELAATHLADGRVRLVLVGGPPATGKTTLARTMADMTGWPVFHSDEVRKELAGLEPTSSAAAPLGGGLYTTSWSQRTYGALLDRARELLERGNSVILDASWSTQDHRTDAADLATQTASQLTSFMCTVEAHIADERAAARAQQAMDASDASPAIAAELRARFAPWPGAVVLDTTEPPDHLARQVLTRLGCR